jgi:phage shock protein C
MEKKLQRDEQHKMIAGVCAGLAEYLSVDITIVRAVFLLALIFHGGGLVAYVILWIVMPKKLYGFNDGGKVDYTVPPQPFGNPFQNMPPQQPGAPFVMPPKPPSKAGVIVGAALVAFGSFFLLDNFDLLPDWQFERLWPVIFIAIGVVFVFSKKKKNPWEVESKSAADDAADEKKDDLTDTEHLADDDHTLDTPTV